MSAIPVPYIGTGGQSQQTLGHYAVAQKSGATVSIAAAGILGSIRWAPSLSNVFLVLMRIKAGWTVTSAVTAATPMDLQAIITRGFTVDFTTASTAAAMSAVQGTNTMRSRPMSTSQMGANGPRICTTAVMSGQTASNDANAFSMTTFANQPSGNATVTQAIGVGGEMKTLYEWTGLGQHPVVLSNLEGVLISTVTAGPTTGSVAYYFVWEWAEVFLF